MTGPTEPGGAAAPETESAAGPGGSSGVDAPTNGHATNGHASPATNGHTGNGHGSGNGTGNGTGNGSGNGSGNGAGNGAGNGHRSAPGERELAAVFGRPEGVRGAFGPGANGHPGSRPSGRHEPPAPALVSAFGRPGGASDTSAPLQRPDRPADADADRSDDFWDDTSSADPWRNPDAAAELGGPALRESHGSSAERPVGARLSARELILGRRVQPTALALLAVVALVLGGVGGVVGWAVAGGADRLVDPGASLTPVSPGRERPPGSVADVAGRVAPAVVSLELQAGSSGGTGSGVVLSPDGYIVTNNHVVELAATDPRATLEAVFASGLRAPARVVGRDPQTDVAVVKVELANPVVAQLGRSSDLQVGDGVIAIGSPLGLAGTVTEGIVSSVDRPVRLDAESAESNPVIDAIQTDAAINPGNSGGALVDTSGAVVGINTAIRTLGGGEGGSIGLGFAIPIDDVRVIAESIIRTGGYTHSDLGVNAKSVTDGASDGAQVLNVRQGGPASRAGLLEGDVVLRVDDRPIASADELVVAVREHPPGQAITLGVVRQGRPLSLQVTL
ncbi:S1C family serine protease [Actinomycetospora callitridis]|uniref:S1C family serine protease n=1 Tax=Actinomycetospora callitridis TaxID=913944 RepID=UPI00236547CF|nr:trypsin-like peptidase domain-containing protein [Actinomycetospora callitridis]MDD7917410.1 trypsin-like peptidase domain-containing protein [Actinomycetospora callitridis]